MHQLYWSVLGAIAWCLLTRPDIAVFVGALQRYSHAPKVIHAKRLNAVVRWAQRNPKKLFYGRLGSSETHLRMYSDAAFKKEEETGHSMRGAIFVRCSGTDASDMVKTTKGHLIEFKNGAQRRVNRSTFIAELQSACDTQDKGFLIAQLLHEACTGDISAASGKDKRDNGGYQVPMALYIDALSVYTAITATFVKIPAENGALCHLLYLRELMEHNVLFALIWTDTRDMLADGLTKGSVDREALHQLMNGDVVVTKDMKMWRPKRLLKTDETE